MTEEITRHDIDEDGNLLDDDNQPDLTTSGIVNLHLVEKAMKICRRTVRPFHSPSEKNKWLKIDKQHTKGMISERWIEFMYDWAREKNKHRTVIVMKSLATAILNKARMTDYLSSHPDVAVAGPTIDMGGGVTDTIIIDD